jgi:hypothetical protein
VLPLFLQIISRIVHLLYQSASLIRHGNLDAVSCRMACRSMPPAAPVIPERSGALRQIHIDYTEHMYGNQEDSEFA